MTRQDFAARYGAGYTRFWLTAVGLIGDRSYAEDIVQEAVAIAWSKRTEFAPNTNFAAWLTAIVRRCAANYSRKLRTRATHAVDPLSLDGRLDTRTTAETPDILPKVTADLSSYQQNFDDEMMRALSLIHPDARCCLLLRVVHELSYREIAEQLGMPEGTAMSHVHRTKAQLRQYLTSLNAPND